MSNPNSRQRVRRIVVLLVLAGAGTASAVLLTRREETPPVAAPEIFKTAEVTSGTLSTTERIDGSLVLSDSLAVLHRIDGETPVVAAPASSSSPTGSNSTGPTAQGITAIAEDTSPPSEAVVIPTTAPCPPDSTVPSTSTPTPPTTSPEPTTPTPPEPTTPTPPEPTTPTPPEPTNPDETPPGTTAPDDTSPHPTPPTTVPSSNGCDGSPTPPSGPGGGVTRGPTGGPSVGGSSNGSNAQNARTTQTITSVIAAEATVGNGDVLYTVDSEPVVALIGALPAWRTLTTSSDAGPDVQQLESSLVALGYDPDGEVVVDTEFDADTEAMVERWQRGLGREETGEVVLGSVVFIPTPTTVSGVEAQVGDVVGEGDRILTLASATQQIVIDVPDGDEAILVPGLRVTLGGGGTGRVSLLRSTERDGAVVVQAVIVSDAPINGAGNGSTITVTVSVDDVSGVLIVPSEALLSKLDGTYAVQTRAADGTVSWVTVDVLGVSGSKAGIRGEGIGVGTLVLVPV